MKERPSVLQPQVCLHLKKNWQSLSTKKKTVLIVCTSIAVKVAIYCALLFSINWQMHLLKAAKNGDLAKAKTALFFFADPDQISNFDGKNWSPKTHAIVNKHPRIIHLFGQKGANFDYTFEVGKKDYHVSSYVVCTDHAPTINAFVKAGGKLNNSTPDGKNALTYAIKSHKKVAAKTITQHLDINVPDNAGILPLTYTLTFKDSTARKDWYTYLVSLGAKEDVVDKDGNTPMHQVMSSSNILEDIETLKDVCDWLSPRKKSGINRLNKKGFSPLMIAAKKRNEKILDIFVKNGGDLIAKDKSGKTVFDYFDSKNDHKLFAKYAKHLQKTDVHAFRVIKLKHPHRISISGKIMKKPNYAKAFPKYTPNRSRRGYSYKRKKGSGFGRKLLRRLGPIGFFASFLF